MLVKGIIKTIDFTGNTCTVRIPTFESHRADQYIVTAAISNQPGCYNGYKEEDVVWIGFDTDQYNQPVVLGKLYLGAAKEKEDPRGTVNAETTIASTSASIPFDTVLSNGVDPSIPNTQANYTSLQKLSNQVNESTQAITKATTDFGNRITQLITDTDNTGAQYKSLIQQTAREIKAQVSQETAERKANDEEIKTTAKAELDIQAGEIKAQVENKVDTESGSISSGFGWSLSKDNWKVFASADVTNMSSEERQALVDDADLSIWSNTTYEIRKDKDGNPVKDEEGNIIVDAVVSDYFYINGVKTNISTKDVDLGYAGTPLTTSDLHLELKLVNGVYYWSLVNNKTSKYKIVSDSSGSQFAANTKPVLIAMEDGIYVNGSGVFKGTITAEEGHIGKFVIGKENINGVSYLLVPNLSEADFNKGTYYTNGSISSEAEECYVQVELQSYGTDTGAQIAVYASTDRVVPSGQTIRSLIQIYVEFSYIDFFGNIKQAHSQLEFESGRTFEIAMRDDYSWSEDPTAWLDYIEMTFWQTSTKIENISATEKIKEVGKEITSEEIINKQTFTKADTWNSILSKHNYYRLIMPAGIYSNGYLDEYGNQITSFNQQPMKTATGVYLGIDGLRLGDTFSVDASGTVTATGLTIDLSNKQATEIAQLIKQVTSVTVQYGISNSASTLPSTWYSSAEAANAKVGDYLWKQTITTYNTGSPVTENTVTHIAENGNTVSTKNLYILSDTKPSQPSNTTTTTKPDIPSGWTETPQQATKETGKHSCWSCVCTITHSTDSASYSTVYSNVVQYTIYNGIVSTEVTYLQTDKTYGEDIAQATDWESTRPVAKAGYYIWTKTSTTFVDSTLDTITYSSDYTAKDGKQGQTRSVTTNNIYFYYANTSNKWDSSAETLCPTIKYDEGSGVDIDASGNWLTTVITPTQSKPYVWQCIRTVTTTIIDNNTTVSCKDGEPAIYNSMDGLISILSADGIELIYKNENDGTYNLRADNLSGAIGNQVNIGGQTTYTKVLYSDTYDATKTYYYKSGTKYVQYADLTADNFTEKVNSEAGVYTLAFLDGWAIKPATDSTSAAIYSGDITEFADASDLVGQDKVTGVYIGTDGIRLGNNFSVDTAGNVSATGLTINLTDKQKENITQSVIQSSKQYVKTEYSYGKGTATTAPVNWYTTITEVDAKAGDYIWTRSTVYYTTNGVESTEIKDSIEHLAENGDTVTTDTIYKLADAMPNKPENSMSTTAPSVPDGWSTVPLQATKESGKHYCYVCEATTTHTKNSASYTTVYSDVQQFSYYSGIVSTETKYLATTTNYSSSEITKVTKGWISTRPDNASGYYIWTWIKTNYVDTSLDTNEYYCDYTASNGVSRNIDLTTTAYVVKKTISDGVTTYDPTQITLTCTMSADAIADKYNLTFEVPNYNNDSRTDQTAAIQTKTIDSATLFNSGSTAKIKVSYVQNTTITLEDTVNIAVISDGQNGANGKDGVDGTNGKDGTNGADGVGISSIDNYYATTTTQSAPQAATITSASILPIDSINKYLWQKTIITYTNNTSKTSVALAAAFGDQGVQGVQGPKGEDGSTQYTWVKYADTPTSGMSNTPDGKTYIGFAYNKSTSEESTAYEDYSWSLIKGDTGEPGEDGNGIKAIAYYYGVTSTSTIPSADTITESDLSNVTIDPTNKYLWQKEVITYTAMSEPQITTTLLAVYGDKGQDGTNGTNGLVMMLTNPTMTLRGDSVGVIADQQENTEVLVYSGLTRVTTDTAQSIYYSLGTISSPTHEVSTDIDSNQYIITLTSKQTDTLSGKIEIPVTVHYGETDTVTQNLCLSWTTAQKGADGSEGKSVSVTTTNLYFYYANTSSKWDSSAETLCPTIKYDSSKGPNVDDNGKWTLTSITPTSEFPYVWQCIRTVTTTTINDKSTIECKDGEPAIYNSMDGLISILSADGIELIYKNENDGTYNLRADNLSGAIGNQVTIGGEDFGWQIQSANANTAAAIHTDGYTSFKESTSMGDSGIYIGTDGIRCGKNFTVDADGNLTAKSLQVTVHTKAYYAVNNSDTEHPTAPTSESLGDWKANISEAKTSTSQPYRWTCTVPLVNNTPDFSSPSYTVSSSMQSGAATFTYETDTHILTITYFN